MVVNKGKTVVESTLLNDPSTSVSKELSPLISNVVEIQPLIESSSVSSREFPPTTNLNYPKQQAEATSSRPVKPISKPYCQSTFKASIDSVITTINGTQNYATKACGSKLQENNQFSMLGEDTIDTTEEGEVTDLASPPPKHCLLPDHTFTGSKSPAKNLSSSVLHSGRNKNSRNKHHSSSGKKIALNIVINDSKLLEHKGS